jgi:release factor glutamine methyltransferase
VADRIDFLEGDLLAARPAEEVYDFVVSNPPYVSLAEYEQLPQEVKGHEPRVALVAGPSGAEVTERLVRECLPRLHQGGWLLFETSPMIAERCRGLVGDAPQWAQAQVFRDASGHARVVQARRA